MSCKLKKNKWDPIVPLIFQRLCEWLPMFDFVIFCHLLRPMGIYRVVVFEWFRYLFSSFSFLFFFFSVLHFLFFCFFFCLSLSLSGTPLTPGPWTLSTHATQLLRHRSPSGYLSGFVVSFLPFFSFLIFIFCSFFFCLSLSLGGPFNSGPLDIVHPCHPVATPLL